MRTRVMDSEKHRDLGSWVGLQRAFAAVAGSCSAARAQCLKQVRDSRILDQLGFTWDEFCTGYAGISRGHGWRWNVESNLRSLQQTLHLQQPRSRSVDGVQKKLFTAICACLTARRAGIISP